MMFLDQRGSSGEDEAGAADAHAAAPGATGPLELDGGVDALIGGVAPVEGAHVSVVALREIPIGVERLMLTFRRNHRLAISQETLAVAVVAARPGLFVGVRALIGEVAPVVGTLSSIVALREIPIGIEWLMVTLRRDVRPADASEALAVAIAARFLWFRFVSAHEGSTQRERQRHAFVVRAVVPVSATGPARSR